MASQLSQTSKRFEPTEWVPLAMRYIDEYEKTGKAPLKYSLTQRVSSVICCAVPCTMCFMWSCMWRLVCCPGQCFCKGPGYMCSDNGCTACSDGAIASYIEENSKTAVLPTLNIPRILTPQDTKSILDLLDRLQVIFATTVYSKFHYTITDVVVAPLATLAKYEGCAIYPTNVPDILSTIKGSMN